MATITRIALFGGTFDPIHKGHTHVAQHAAKQLEVDQLVYIPAKQSPLKINAPHVTDEQRVHMIQLAIAGCPEQTISTCELERPAPSYTIDTIRNYREQNKALTAIYWLIGADAVIELGNWYCIRELLQECRVITMRRADCPIPDFHPLRGVLSPDHVEKLKNNVLETPAIPISSSKIRARLQQNRSVDDMLHPAVRDYIVALNLYGG
ncbi:nicotinate (nicotinamide) nucleotide adenylyltransferase [Planctomycetota bacterium]